MRVEGEELRAVPGNVGAGKTKQEPLCPDRGQGQAENRPWKGLGLSLMLPLVAIGGTALSGPGCFCQLLDD